jgi:hypothetical protein
VRKEFGGVASLSVSPLWLVPAGSISIGACFGDFSGIQLLSQVSNIVIIVLPVCDSFEYFNLGSSLIKVVFVV